MVLSCCAWALTQAEPEALRLLHGLGLTAIDIRPSWLRSEDAASTREQLDLDVICLAATHEKPDGATFDSDNPDAVASMAESLNLETTLFVVSSKSGGTLETLSFYVTFRL